MPEELAMTRHGALDCCVEGLLTFYLLLDIFLGPASEVLQRRGRVSTSWSGCPLCWAASPRQLWFWGQWCARPKVRDLAILSAARGCPSAEKGMKVSLNDMQKAFVKCRRAGTRLQLRSRWAFIAGWLAGAARLDRCLMMSLFSRACTDPIAGVAHARPTGYLMVML